MLNTSEMTVRVKQTFCPGVHEAGGVTTTVYFEGTITKLCKNYLLDSGSDDLKNDDSMLYSFESIMNDGI